MFSNGSMDPFAIILNGVLCNLRLQCISKAGVLVKACILKYSRTSVAGTLMPRLPRLFRTRS